MIYYFSATGNSKYVASRIAQAIGDKTCSLVGADTDVVIGDREVFGIVTPTNWWELPVLVRAFMQTLTFSGRPSYVFLVATYGTTPGCCGEDARRILKRKGICLDASFSVRMPDNWTPLFDLSDAAKVAETNRLAEPQIDGVIERIGRRLRGNHTERRLPYAVRIVTDPILNLERQTKHFHVEDNCIGCGLCERKCPVGAIEIVHERPVWMKDRCALCLGCLHRCPKFAIQYGRHTKQHGQYLHPGKPTPA